MSFLNEEDVNNALNMCYSFVSSFTNYDFLMLFGLLSLPIIVHFYLEKIKEAYLLSKFIYQFLSYVPLIAFIMKWLMNYATLNYIKLVFFNI